MNKKKVFVGISGGVDSSVAAYLLKKEGYEVHGVFVKTWSPEWLPCTWLAEKRDAMRVCAALDIPFHFLDAEKEYKEGVAEYMIGEYRAGRTPNPDVMCNRVIKFGIMWQYVKDNGGEALATGHYARVVNKNELVDSRNEKELQTTSYSLLTGVDKSKDQSYFLWMLKREEIHHILFPIGHLQKSEVRKIAERAKLLTATKKDSQGICFLGDVDMREFLSHYIEIKEGNVLDIDGNVIGKHDGVWFYTLGERHGFKIKVKDTNEKPYYVVAKDVDKNLLIVSQTIKNNSDTGQNITLVNTNWLEKIEIGRTYSAQIRYHGTSIEARFINENEIILKDRGIIALGQSLVVYDGDILVGGSIVDKVS